MTNLCHLAAVLIAVFSSTVCGETTSDPIVDWFSRNLCIRFRCKNDGYCSVVADNIAVCNCPVGFTGTHCEYREIFHDQDKCQDYCMNGGTCDLLESINLAICSCPIGYTGNRCQTLDENWLNWPLMATVDPAPLNGFGDFPDDTFNQDDIPGKYPASNPEEFVEDGSSLWIAIITVIAVVILSMMYGMLHYMVRQRRRRRAVLIRTIQVAARDSALRNQGVLLAPGATRPGFFSIMTRTPVRSIRCGSARIEQAAIPSQFESDSAPLVSAEMPPAVMGRYITSDFQRMPSVLTTGAPPTGAPPPYAQVAPEEGGHSMDEPPPPYY